MSLSSVIYALKRSDNQSGDRQTDRQCMALSHDLYSLFFPPPFASLFLSGDEEDNFVDDIQSASISRSQGLLDSYCRSSPGWWAILQLLCSQARRKLPEELTQKLSSKPCDRAIDALCIFWSRSRSFHMHGRRIPSPGYMVLMVHVMVTSCRFVNLFMHQI